MKSSSVIIYLAVFAILTNRTESIPKVNKLISKAKQYYKSKFGKDKSWHYLGVDVSEYPGTNPKYRKLNREKWDEYYRCLEKQNENLGTQRSVTPEAVQAFEGGSIKFECKLCLSPTERSNRELVEWDWGAKDHIKLTPVEYTEHIMLSPEEKHLHIYNLGEESTGQYVCSLGESVTSPYFLTVVNSSTKMREVHTKYTSTGPFAAEPEYIPEYNIILDTEWGPWSPCNKCGKIGKRHRLGYCTVRIANDEEKLNKMLERGVTNATHARINENVTESPKKYTGKPANIQPVHLQLLSIFTYGIPCQSHILPDPIKNLAQVKARLSEIMLGYCKEPCPENKIFEVKDEKGKMIERANNSAGIFSMLQGMPPIESPVERRLIYAAKSEKISLSCPGNLNTDAPILWQIGSKNIVPDLLNRESSGRIYVSVMDKIYIKQTHLADSNIYSCWQRGELAGTVRLVVENRVQLNFNHHVMLLGTAIILGTFLYVFTRAFLGKRHAKI